jgi:hypothetical protein
MDRLQTSLTGARTSLECNRASVGNLNTGATGCCPDCEEHFEDTVFVNVMERFSLAEPVWLSFTILCAQEAKLSSIRNRCRSWGVRTSGGVLSSLS